jgi:hypothetical protein
MQTSLSRRQKGESKLTVDDFVKSPPASLRGAKRRGNLIDVRVVMRLLRFARNDKSALFGLFTKPSTLPFCLDLKPYLLKGVFKAHHAHRPVVADHSNASEVIVHHQFDGMNNTVVHTDGGFKRRPFLVRQEDFRNLLSSHLSSPQSHPIHACGKISH